MARKITTAAVLQRVDVAWITAPEAPLGLHSSLPYQYTPDRDDFSLSSNQEK